MTDKVWLFKLGYLVWIFLEINKPVISKKWQLAKVVAKDKNPGEGKMINENHN